MDSEWELIRRCRGGSTASFEPLVRNHQRRALLVARGLLGDREEASDAVQEAFVKAFRALHRLQAGSEFGPWFRSILRNHCLDRLRISRPPETELKSEVVDAHVWSEPTALRRLEQQELSKAVRDALEELSPEHRQILVLKEIEEMSYLAIAEAMGIPEGTVGSRLYHARAGLRRVLTERGISAEGL